VLRGISDEPGDNFRVWGVGKEIDQGAARVLEAVASQ
jgi:hypothetical protein